MNTQIATKGKKQDVQQKVTPQSQEALRTVRAVPRVDILENADGLLLVAELPGVQAGSVELQFAHDTLTLKAVRKPEIAGTPVLGQLVAVEYVRSFLLPQGIDATRISAKHQNGLLEVQLPKAASHKPRTIAVKAS